MDNNILIKGTTHLDSSESIIQSIQEFNPDIIGVELCETRLNIMVKNPLNETNSKEDTSLIGKISNAIKKKAEQQKIVYGSDMITASRYALDNNIQLVCLDKDINETRTLMDKIPEKEMEGFIRESMKLESEDLTKQIRPEEVLKQLKDNYPVAFEFLITSRELYLENKLLKLIKNNPNKRIIVFLGKGHVEKIERGING